MIYLDCHIPKLGSLLVDDKATMPTSGKWMDIGTGEVVVYFRGFRLILTSEAAYKMEPKTLEELSARIAGHLGGTTEDRPGDASTAAFGLFAGGPLEGGHDVSAAEGGDRPHEKLDQPCVSRTLRREHRPI